MQDHYQPQEVEHAAHSAWNAADAYRVPSPASTRVSCSAMQASPPGFVPPPGPPGQGGGFWDTVRSREARPPGDRNRRVERMVRALGGIKSLYSDSWYAEDEFWAIYTRAAYGELKRRYDPSGVLGDLYDKCVRRRG